MSEDLADRIEALDAKATAGEWLAPRRTSVIGSGIIAAPVGRMVGDIFEHDNAALIVALRNAVPEILAALRLAETSAALPDAAGLVDRKYIIRKGGYFYRPNSQGYTINASEAGRYTLVEAERLTHPNGKDGPRDGLSFLHEDELPPLTTQAQRNAELEAENARLRKTLATIANSFNIVGSHYDHAVQALDAMVRSIKTQARAALGGSTDV